VNILALGFGNFGGPDVFIIVLIVLILFGAKKLPDLARSLGQSMNEFKKAREDIDRELHEGAKSTSAPSSSSNSAVQEAPRSWCELTGYWDFSVLFTAFQPEDWRGPLKIGNDTLSGFHQRADKRFSTSELALNWSTSVPSASISWTSPPWLLAMLPRQSAQEAAEVLSQVGVRSNHPQVFWHQCQWWLSFSSFVKVSSLLFIRYPEQADFPF
jgi:sec-independent protein translocase protein TatA